MAKYVIVFIIVAMILPASFLMGGEEKKRPFRNVEWGMTMKEVRKAEQKAELVKETKEKNKRLSEMTYKTKLNNTSFLLRYYFADDKLYAASYICDDNFEDSNRYVEEYYACL